jgi:hypothetical protein
MGFIVGAAKHPTHLVLNPASNALEEGLLTTVSLVGHWQISARGFLNAVLCRFAARVRLRGQVSFHRKKSCCCRDPGRSFRGAVDA